ncbi:MAG: DNA double-strand break repair nuclease NurA, partial [Candidatus Aenigmatarchaeota archaeon]
MKDFLQMTDEIAKRISETESQRSKLGKFLREVNSSTNLTLGTEIFEEKIFQKINPIALDGLKVGGVDGGLVKQTLHGIDLMLTRAVGVLFSFSGDKLNSTDYYPQSIPSPTPNIIVDPFSELEFEVNSNIERMITEATTAAEFVQKFKPEILFMHGSIVPHYTDKPAKTSLIFPSYQRMIEAYTHLFSACKETNTILAGVIEDSRGTRFCEIVNSQLISKAEGEIVNNIKILLNQTKDTNLLTYALEPGERSLVFKYSSNPENHPILNEFGGQVANQIFTFYLRTAEFDRPIRIDFFANQGISPIANRISSIILPLCGHSGYGIPSVLIEADQRAKLSEDDLQMFYQDL